MNKEGTAKMQTPHNEAMRTFHPDDIAVWPDGTWASLGDVWIGHYNWMSDDYEKVRLADVARLQALGIAEDVLGE
jgi:hypothetical protein